MAQHARTDRSASARKDDVIQIRAAAELKAMLSRAASLRGQKLSEFMLASARREAEATILDQRTFFLDAESHEQFLNLLDSPPAPPPALEKLMKRGPLWNRGSPALTVSMSTRCVTLPARLNVDHDVAAFDHGRTASMTERPVERALARVGAP